MRRKIIGALLITIVAALAVAGGDDKLASEATKVRGYELRLEDREGKCVVAYTGRKRRGETTLEIPPPCQFARNWRGEPQSYTYQDLGPATVLIVVGGPLDARRTDPLMKEGCGTQAQAILLRRSGVSASKKIGKGSTLCPSAGLDEKMFSFLAH